MSSYTKSNKTQKILVVTPSLKGLGGVANYYKALLPYLKNGDFVIDNLAIGSVNSKTKILHPLTDQIRFNKTINRHNYTLVHLNPSMYSKSFIRDGLLTLQAKKKGILVVIFFRGWDKKFELKVESFLLTLFRMFYGKADAFIVLASEFRSKLLSWGIKAPIYLQTTAVDPLLLEGFDINVKLRRLANKKTLRLLYLARLAREKGVFETIDALRILREKNIDIDLTVAGDGPVYQELKKYVQSIEMLRKNVKFTGYIRGQMKADLLKKHDIYCLPTFGEGMPNSVLEALTFGMPVITCPVGGLVDIFKNGVMGVLVPQRDPRAIADVLENYYFDREKLVQISLYNYKYAKRFLAPNVAKALLNIYAATLNSVGN